MKRVPLAFAVALAGRSLIGEGERLVVMPVEEVHLPDIVHAGEPSDVTFVGLLLNTAHTFERFDIAASARRADVTMLARLRPGGARAWVRSVQRTRTLPAPAAGTYIIRVRQRDGSVTEWAVCVE